METKFTITPIYAGHWQVGGAPGLSIYLSKRPRWLTRVLMRWLVEWEWVDE